MLNMEVLNQDVITLDLKHNTIEILKQTQDKDN